MTYSETIVSVILLSIFIVTFTHAIIPAMDMFKCAQDEYDTIRSVEFIDMSFRKECSTVNRNIEKWKTEVSAVSGMEKCETTELYSDGKVCAIKAECIIGGKNFVLIAECGI